MGSRKLSNRESLILGLAASGFTDKQIANDLSLSIGTVRTYWNRIRNKLDAATRAQAVGLHVRGSADMASSALVDVTQPIIVICDKTGLPCWTVNPKGQVLKALNRSGARFLESFVSPSGHKLNDWTLAIDSETSAGVHRAISVASSRNPGNAKVARVWFPMLKKRGHLVFFPLLDGDPGCCVVFVTD